MSVFLGRVTLQTQEMGAGGGFNAAGLRHGLAEQRTQWWPIWVRSGLRRFLDFLAMTKVETVVLPCSPERKAWKIVFSVIRPASGCYRSVAAVLGCVCVL